MNIDRIIWTPLERDIIARIVWTPLVFALTFLVLLSSGHAQNVNDLIINRRIASTGRVDQVFWRSGFTITDGLLTVDAPAASVAGVTGLQAALDGKLSSTGTYTNPEWLVSIPFSKLTNLPTTLLGHGITSFETEAFKLSAATNSLGVGESGLGWVSSRLTLQGGGGSLQWYQSGAEKIMAWSGKIQAASLDLSAVSVFTTAPASATSSGEPGQMAFDAGYLYICVALNTWRRVALSSW